MKKQTFNIPDGCKTVTFEQVGNQVITTFEPEVKFKEGDFIYSEWEKSTAISILNENNNKEYNFIICYASLHSKNGLIYNSYIVCEMQRTDRLATESEKQILIDALAKDGKMWDAEKLPIIDLKYIPKVGDCVKLERRSVLYGEVKSINFNKIITYKVIRNGKIFDYESLYWELNVRGCKETKITREELQAEFNKIGYQYDFETHMASKIRWEPKFREKYYYVDYKFDIIEDFWYNCKIDNNRFKIGNCYKTPEEAEPRRTHYLSFKD